MQSVKILVVEDNASHVADFKAMFEREAPRFPFDVEVVYAVDYATATYLVEKVDGVLSDVFYPVDRGGPEQACGHQLAMQCLNTGVPVVLCTSTNHHGRATEPVHQWAMSRGFRLYDASADIYDNEAVAEHKPWLESFFGLLVFIVGMREGVGGIGIRDGRVICDNHCGYRLVAEQILRDAPPLMEVTQRFVRELGFPRDPKLDDLPPEGPIRI